MTKSISSVVDASFIRRFQGIASSSSSGSTFSSSSSAASKSSISSGLRYGAQMYSTAIQNLNSAISFVNVGSSSVETLEKLTDKMLELAETAADSSTGSDRRRRLSEQYKEAYRTFENVSEAAKLGDSETLTAAGLSEVFARVGLDPQDSNDSERVLSRFEDIEAVSTREISTREGARNAVKELKALKLIMDDDAEVFEEARELLGKNVNLVRATGLAFLDISKEITSEDDATEVAARLQERIRSDARSALSQAENLNSIAAAALASVSSEA